MKKTTRFVGLDVHAKSIAVAVAETAGEVRSLGTIPNRPESIRKLVKKLGKEASLRVCYEAGPCGYVLYWQLTELGIACEVVAPTLVPTKPGDRVKTDRRDAEKLARCHRSGDLTAVWVPDAEHEALRDLVRARHAAKDDQRRARNRLQKFLLRHGCQRPTGIAPWGTKHHEWLRAVRFDHAALEVTREDYLHEVDHAKGRLERLERAIEEAIEQAPEEIRAVVAGLQALRGVATTTAVGVVVEVGEFSRFESPRQLMAYTGVVPSEHSTGGPGKARRGGITKTGNTQLRRLVIEASWSYRHRPGVYPKLKKRQDGLDAEIIEISWRAQKRLHKRYRHLMGRGKEAQKSVTAVGRELLAFMWEIGVHVEAQQREVSMAS